MGRIVFTVLACVLVAVGAPASGADVEHGQTLAGAWNITIVFDDPTLVGCTTPGLNTADGGVIAQGCDLSESPGYGQWRRTPHGEFAVTFSGLNFGPPGTGITGSYKVRARLQVNGETFTGPFVTDIFAPDGTVLFRQRELSRRSGLELSRCRNSLNGAGLGSRRAPTCEWR